MNIDLIIESNVKKYGTVLVIDTNNMVKNYNLIQNTAKDSIVSWVLKNNAYGLGVENIFPIARKVGCKDFYVATLEEAVALRNMSSDSNIYVLHGVLHKQEELFIQHNLIPVLNTLSQVDLWNNFAKKVNKTLPCFLHIETGINRLAIEEKDIDFIVNNKEVVSHLDIKYVMSHFACSDIINHHSIEEQYNKFVLLIKKFPNAKYSLAASYAIFLDNKYHFNMVRPAVGIYGGKMEGDIQPVIHLYSAILQVKNLKKGDHVGYGYRWQANRDTKVAVVPCGYADGVIRTNTNKGFAFIKGYKVPIIGTVSMDLITLDITDIPSELQHEGVLVELIGRNQTLDQFSSYGTTVHCETLNILTTRYPRVFV